TPAPTSRTHISLASQTPWVAPGGIFDARLTVDTDQPLPSLELIVTVYFPLRTRSDFARSLDGHVESPLRSSPSTTLDQLQRDQAGAVSVVMPVQDPAKPTDPTALPLRREGVYPVQVEVRGAGGGPLLDRLTTHLLFFPPIDPTSGQARMDFAWALPLTAPVALQTGGSSQLDPAARATLSDLSQALTSPDHLAEPVDLVPTPETMHALSASADPTDRATLASLARAAQATEVVDGTYVPVDLDAMVGQGLGDELTAQRDRAERVLQSSLGLAPAPGLRVVNGRLGDAALSRLRDEDVSKLVLPEEAFTPESRVTTLASPFVVDDHRLTHAEAASGDPGLAAHFAKGDQVLLAHQLLADLAQIYEDSPGAPRAVVALPPPGWVPTASFVNAVLDGMTASPVIAPTTLSTIFNGTVPLSPGKRRGTADLRTLVAPATPAGLPAEAIRAARRRLKAFSSLLDEDATLPDALDQQLLAAEAATLRAHDRQAMVSAVEAFLDKQRGLVHLPSARSVTLTSRGGNIPLTILSDADYPIRAVIRFQSDKLAFPGGTAVTVDLSPRRNTTEVFAVRARASGSFPVTVRLTSSDGQFDLGQSQLT
ncbi:MAG TPA: DUF6049 family protein, partial [Acidimicrobiales bacterium]